MIKYQVVLVKNGEAVWNCGEAFDTLKSAEIFLATVCIQYYVDEYEHFMGETLEDYSVRIEREDDENI